MNNDERTYDAAGMETTWDTLRTAKDYAARNAERRASPNGLHITYAAGKIRAFQPNGDEVKNIKAASIQLNENGMSEALLYFGIKTISLHDVKRGSDGVRETRG